MSEAIGNHDDLEPCLSADDELKGAKLLRTYCRNNDEDYQRYGNDDVYYSSPRRDPREIDNYETAKIAELKYRNLYSMSIPTGHHVYWNSRRGNSVDGKSRIPTKTMEISTNFFNEKIDETSDENKRCNYLDDIREYLAKYQESYGTPRDEYSFVSLMKMMGQATGESMAAIFYIVVNISPLIQLFLFILRFVLDKLISIRNAGCNQQTFVKYAIFGVQLACIYVSLDFIFGFVVMPILHLVFAIIAKILLIN